MAAAEPSPAASAAEILAYLETMRDDANRAGMARFGIRSDKALGIPNAVLRPLARRVKRDHVRALELWETGIREARLLALFTDEPKKVTTAQARGYADDFDSWDVVDHAGDLFCDAGLAKALVPEFAADEREFVRRAAFATIAWAAVHLKKEPDATFLDWLLLIEAHAGDGRNYVKKAVSWALRQIGKRSRSLHGPALELAERLAASEDKARRWIGRDAVKELTDPKQLQRLAGKT